MVGSSEAPITDEDLERMGVPRPGQSVLGGKYFVDGVIGVGGMGIVLAATHVALGQRVAMKFLLRNANDRDLRARERFLREARMMVSVHSEHVVRVMDVGALESGVVYMIMEHLSGTDMGTLIARHGELAISQAVDCVLHALDALGAAHAIGVIHRDIKPSNLFLAHRPDGSSLIKVLDFGVSKWTAENDALSLTITNPGTMLGSPLYMSPEQVRNSREVDNRTDIWSVGVVLFEMLTRGLPFVGDSVVAVAASIVGDEPRRLRDYRPEVPEDLERVVMRCLSKNPEERFATTEELATALMPYATEDEARRASKSLRTVRSIAPGFVLGRKSQSLLAAVGAGVPGESVPPTSRTGLRSGESPAQGARPKVRSLGMVGAIGMLALGLGVLSAYSLRQMRLRPAVAGKIEAPQEPAYPEIRPSADTPLEGRAAAANPKLAETLGQPSLAAERADRAGEVLVQPQSQSQASHPVFPAEPTFPWPREAAAAMAQVEPKKRASPARQAGAPKAPVSPGTGPEAPKPARSDDDLMESRH